jgi:hypothetical protein
LWHLHEAPLEARFNFHDGVWCFALRVAVALTVVLVLVVGCGGASGSGAVAGVVSRTGTAPIDRLKTILQVRAVAPLCHHSHTATL